MLVDLDNPVWPLLVQCLQVLTAFLQGAWGRVLFHALDPKRKNKTRPPGFLRRRILPQYAGDFVNLPNLGPVITRDSGMAAVG